MASNVIKGLTVEIGGDTTKLGKALEDVNKKSRDLSSELGEVNRLLKMDPGNADLLAQKQDILAEAVSNTAKKLDTLKEAERQVQQQFERGEVSEEQVRALKREIEATEQKLGGYKNAVKETADELDNLGKEAGASADELNDFANRGLTVVGGLVTAAAGALVAAAESTREYRTEMGKLNTAFTDNGHSAESAQAAYQELQGVLGETEQAVEAANHLAKLTDNEKDLATWTGDILPGVFATFGASLPIEGLTEAANETAKVGQVTGPLADALTWAGISEDAFNESLAKCTSEQERQKLIMETLAGVYGEASAAYKETNADVIAANKANEAWQASLAQVGAAVEPVITQVKEIAAELLTKLVPVIEGLLNNLPTIAVALAGITAALVSYKLAAIAATAAEKGMTLAQYAAAAAQKVLNAAMAANPIGLVIVAITALVTAFMYLWNNSEKFREFWIKLWEGIKQAALAVVDWFKQVPDMIASFLQTAITKVQEWGGNFVNGIVMFFSQLPSKISTFLTETVNKITLWATNMVTKAIEVGNNFLTGVVTFFQDLPYKIGYLIGTVLGTVARWAVDMYNKAKEMGRNFLNNAVTFFKELPGKVATFLTNTVTRVKTWATNMVTSAKTAASNFLTNTVNFFKQLPGKVASFLTSTLTRVKTWATNMVAAAKTAASNFLTNTVNFFKQLPGKIWNFLKQAADKVSTWATNLVTKGKDAAKRLVSSVVDGIKTLPSKLLNIGKDLVTGLWNGITDKVNWLKDKIKSFAGGILDGIKDAFGVNSPSKETAWIGDMLDQGLAEGVLDNAKDPVKAMQRVSGSVLDAAASGIDGLTLDRQLSRPAGFGTAPAASQGGLADKLDKILAAIERGQILTIDGDQLVGATADRYDATLGQRRALAARGAR